MVRTFSVCASCGMKKSFLAEKSETVSLMKTTCSATREEIQVHIYMQMKYTGLNNLFDAFVELKEIQIWKLQKSGVGESGARWTCGYVGPPLIFLLCHQQFCHD